MLWAAARLATGFGERGKMLAERLAGGCTGCYSNECFAFDPGTGTWFPIRAANRAAQGT